MAACAVFAGRREMDLMSIVEGLASGAKEEAEKQPHPMRAQG